jgi:GTPase SAR1 family protein
MTRNDFLIQLYQEFDAAASFSYYCKSPFYIDDELGDIDIETKSIEQGALYLERLIKNRKLYHLKKHYYTFGASQTSIKYVIWCSTWKSCVQIDFFDGFYVYGQEIRIEHTTDIERYRALKQLVYHRKIVHGNFQLLQELTKNNLFLLFYLSVIKKNNFVRFLYRSFGMAMLCLKTVMYAMNNIKIFKVIGKKLSSKLIGPKVICFLGPDGAGKSTLIHGFLENTLITEYYDGAVTVWHTRPKILPRLGAMRFQRKKDILTAKRNTRPHSAIKVSIIALHALVDFNVGYLYAWLTGKKLCILDRGIPEFLYQPEFAKAPKFIQALCEFQLRRQHMFAIVCDESVLATRKADLSRDEIVLTMKSLDLLKKQSLKLGLNFDLIDTSILSSKANVMEILRRFRA